MRIVSLLPSATEIVCAVGLESCLVGVSHECDFPPSVTRLPRVTRSRVPEKATSGEIDAFVREQLQSEQALYSLDSAMLEALQPDLIVTQSLCQVCAVSETEVEAVARRMLSRPRTLSLSPISLHDVINSLVQVGDAAGVGEQARAAAEGLRRRIAALAARADAFPRRRVAFLEWIDPLFGPGHWNPELIALAGGIDVLGCPGQPSRTVNWEDIRRAQPDVLMISCCGFTAARAALDLPILERQVGWGEMPCVKEGSVFIADGNAFFSRPGPRLVESLEILASAINPELSAISGTDEKSRLLTILS